MTLHNAGSSAGFNIALKREREKELKKREKEYYDTGYSYLVTHPSTNFVQRGRHAVHVVLTLR